MTAYLLGFIAGGFGAVTAVWVFQPTTIKSDILTRVAGGILGGIAAVGILSLIS